MSVEAILIQHGGGDGEDDNDAFLNRWFADPEDMVGEGEQSLPPLPRFSKSFTKAAGLAGAGGEGHSLMLHINDFLRAHREFRHVAYHHFQELEERSSTLEAELFLGRFHEATLKKAAATNHVAKGGSQWANHNISTVKEDAVSIKQANMKDHNEGNHAKAKSNVLEIAENEEKLMQQEAAAAESKKNPRWKRMVLSSTFDLVVGCVIVVNTIILSAQIEYTGRLIEEEAFTDCLSQKNCAVPWPAVESAFFIIEHIFTALFSIELLLRILAQGCRETFRGIANSTDACIVVVSSLDSWIITPLGGADMSNVAILRLVRLVRLSKCLRVVRVMKTFKSLRVLVSAVAASVGALGWSMTLLFVLELIGAIFLSQVLQPAITDDASYPEELRIWIASRFGTWAKAMFSVFEITMSPGGFVKYRRLSEDVHWFFGIVLVLYVCIVTFAVVRVITAMFLKATLSASDQDEARTARERAMQREMYMTRLKQKVDSDGSGGLDHNEFQQLLQIPRMHEWLVDVGLNTQDCHRLFEAMDLGDGEIVLQEFVNALVRMRGSLRPADAVLMLYESRSTLARIRRLEAEMAPRYIDGGDVSPRDADTTCNSE